MENAVKKAVYALLVALLVPVVCYGLENKRDRAAWLRQNRLYAF
jgi:hypothetical protein